jgi:phage tail-like protein
MSAEPGFLHVNVAGEWPSFAQELHDVEITSHGFLRLKPAAGGGFASRGVFRGGPFEVDPEPTPWYGVHAQVDLMTGAHVQLFTFTADDGDASYDATAEQPFGGPGWRPAPRDAFDVLLTNPRARRLWIGGVLRGDGTASPVLRQMRLTWGRDTYLASLPAIYGRDLGRRDFLERVLSLNESVLGRLEGTIADLPLLFDPEAAPDEGEASWLTWLASWLAFERSDVWSQADTRGYVAEAFSLYGRRGTVEGLRRYLKIYAGVEALIEEPGLNTSVWCLGETSILGFTTMLAPGPAEGAVLDATATVDRSHLGGEAGYGSWLFDDLAHRFCVRVHCAELRRPGALADARAVIEREKPAHTAYHLCVIEPRMRVGAQARVGVDAVVAGPWPARLDAPLGMGTLGDKAEPCPPREET